MAKRPLILLSNDDGVHAPGIQAAREALDDLGDVWTCAPDSERSSCSHSMTLNEAIYAMNVSPRVWALSGTPGDAVFIALADILPRKPDLVVSGINSGPNLGKDVVYSGTVAAAREASFRGLRTVAISLQRGADFSHAASFIGKLASQLLKKKVPYPRHEQGGFLLNVNVPEGEPRGVKWTRLGVREYGEHVIKRRSPRKRIYYWLNGGPLDLPSPRGTDVHAVRDGHISVTPLHIDQTDEDAYYYLRDDFSF